MFFFRPAIKLRLPWTRRCCDNQCIKSPSNSLNLLQKARRFLTTRIQYDGLQLGYASCFATSSTDCVATSRDVWELKGFVITRLHSQNERSFPEQIFWSLLTLDNTLRFKNLLSDFEAPTEKHNNSQKTPTNLHPKKNPAKPAGFTRGSSGMTFNKTPRVGVTVSTEELGHRFMTSPAAEFWPGAEAVFEVREVFLKQRRKGFGIPGWKKTSRKRDIFPTRFFGWLGGDDGSPKLFL